MKYDPVDAKITKNITPRSETNDCYTYAKPNKWATHHRHFLQNSHFYSIVDFDKTLILLQNREVYSLDFVSFCVIFDLSRMLILWESVGEI